MTDVTVTAAELEDIVDVDPADEPDLIRMISDLKAGKALADELEQENSELRDKIMVEMKRLDAKKIRVNGKIWSSLSSVPKTSYDWALLNRLAPKAVAKAKIIGSYERLNLGRITSK